MVDRQGPLCSTLQISNQSAGKGVTKQVGRRVWVGGGGVGGGGRAAAGMVKSVLQGIAIRASFLLECY